MINAMKYKKEISNVGYDFRILEKNNKIVGCGSCADEMKCQECKFGYDEQGRTCDITRTEWLCQEYKEPIKLSRLEFELLKYFKGNGFEYIVIDKNQKCVHIYTNKPKRDKICWFYESGDVEFLRLFKDRFQFVKWEDKEPTSIQDILENCEVAEDVN